MSLTMDPSTYEYLVQQVAKAFVTTCTLVSHQTDSYEHYVHYQIPEIIRENSPLQIFCAKQSVMHIIHMEKVCIGKPVIKEANGFIRKLSPKEAFLRRQSYLADVFVDLRHEEYRAVTPKHYKLKEIKIFQNVLLLQIPCMRNSSLCNDYGSLDRIRDPGTFIINGYEKCIITQVHFFCLIFFLLLFVSDDHYL